MLNKINISPDRQKLIVYLVLIVVTFAVFWQVHQYDFINFDDNYYVTGNRVVQSGITMDGFYWAFTATDKLWTPLLWLSFMLDYQFYGLNAGAYHLTNLILHILSALLLFWLFNRMTGAIWKSAFVAALFALHPLHVESVAWIVERKDVLSAFFWMLTLCLYVYYTEKPVIKRYLLVLFGFVLALMSKPMVVTLPVMMILLDYWPLGRFESKKGNLVLWQLKEKIPFFVLSAVLSVFTFYYSQKIDDTEPFPFISRLANAPVAFVTYLEKTFWPHDMAIFYPFPTQIPVWQVIGASLLILIITTAVIVMIKRLPYLFVGWMWLTIAMLPVSGIIYQIWLYSMADRYHYLPSIGLAVMMAWGIPALIKSEEIRRKLLFPVGVASLAILAVLTWQQCGYWKNSITLWNHALKVTDNNWLAYYTRGHAYAHLGNYKQAIEDFNWAIEIKPGYPSAYLYRGNVYYDLGNYKQAIEDLSRAIEIKPGFGDAYYTRGHAYAHLGNYKQAIDDFSRTIEIKPGFADAYNNRGIAYSALGNYRQAIDDFSRAIEIKPGYAEAYNNRAFIYLKQGDNISGCRDARKACELGNCKLLEMAKGKGDCR
jgi:tetratricopeptide (TPR) repeat protein